MGPDTAAVDDRNPRLVGRENEFELEAKVVGVERQGRLDVGAPKNDLKTGGKETQKQLLFGKSSAEFTTSAVLPDLNRRRGVRNNPRWHQFEVLFPLCRRCWRGSLKHSFERAQSVCCMHPKVSRRGWEAGTS